MQESSQLIIQLGEEIMQNLNLSVIASQRVMDFGLPQAFSTQTDFNPQRNSQSSQPNLPEPAGLRRSGLACSRLRQRTLALPVWACALRTDLKLNHSPKYLLFHSTEDQRQERLDNHVSNN